MKKSIAIDVHNSSNIFIENLRVEGFDVAVSSKNVENLTIKDAVVFDCNNGFMLTNSKNVDIRSVDFHSNSRYLFFNDAGHRLKAIAVFLDIALKGKID